MHAEEKLKELGLVLPPVAEPLGAYVPAVHVGNLVFVSGQLPRTADGAVLAGKLGREVTIEQGQEAARQAALHLLAVLRRGLGSLDRVARVVKIEGFVASDPTFTEQPAVVNGASDLMGEVFGEHGRHARVAVGVAALPKDAPVEIAGIFEVEPEG